MNQVVQLLSALQIRSGRLRAMTSSPGQSGVTQPIVPVEHVERWLASLPPSNNVWISTSTFGPEQRGTYANVVGINSLTLDLDVKAGGMPTEASCMDLISAVEAIFDSPAAVVVNSGGGIQAHWAVDDMDAAWEPGDEHTRRRWADLSKRFYSLAQALADERGGKIDATQGIERVWRAPGTVNTKEGRQPLRAELIRAEEVDGLTYDVIDDALRAVGIEAEPEAERPVAFALGASELPAAVQPRERAYTQKTVEGIQDQLRALRVDAGIGWDNTAVRAAFRLVELAESPWCSLDVEGARAALVEAMPTDAGFPVERVLQKFDSALHRRNAGRGVEPPAWLTEKVAEIEATQPEALQWARHEMTDFGNVDRLLRYAGGKLLWVHATKSWMLYDARRWVADPVGGQVLAQRMVRELPELEAGLYSPEPELDEKTGKPKPSERAAFYKWADKQRTGARVKDCADLARTSGRITAHASDFDSQKMVLNCANGVLNLASGKLGAHDPDLRLSKISPVSYDPNAKAPQWQTFLDKVMPDREMQQYLQRITGYTLTGETSAQAMFIHHGKTANGKSVYLRVLEHVMGDYSQVVPPNTLMAKKADQHPTDIARMEGRRFLQMDETRKGARLDDEVIKRLTGQGTITARGMGQDFRDFQLVGKIHLVTNHLPHVDAHQSMARRVRMVHWPITIPESERDPGLADRIIAQESAGVLAWAVQGAMAWLSEGLRPPLQAQIDAETYFAEEDEFAGFLLERTMPCGEINSALRSTSARLYATYLDFCSGSNMKPMSKIAFCRELANRGVGRWRDKRGNGFDLAVVAEPAPWQQPQL